MLKMKQKINELETQITEIKERLMGLGDLRPGSLSTQYNVCGNPKCHCKHDPPQKHGPYYQLSFSRKGRSRTKFIKKPYVEMVRDQITNYAELRLLVDEWIDVSMELCQLKIDKKEAEK